MSDLLCPRCGIRPFRAGDGAADPPALSRDDDTTDICAACGTDEALRALRGEPMLRDTWADRHDGWEGE